MTDTPPSKWPAVLVLSAGGPGGMGPGRGGRGQGGDFRRSGSAGAFGGRGECC